MKPNIFDIATKELSQDSFITWLLQFADDKYLNTDQRLCECGKEFTRQLIKRQVPNFGENIFKVEAGRQWENIDIWAEVNNKYLIIIEDKTSTSYHSNQLIRYKETAELWCSNKKYEPPICIYLKTGSESQNSLNQINQQGFSIFKRIDFITLLDEYKDIRNNIFIDFYERLNRIEKSNNDFEIKQIKDWDGSNWQGFFQFLEKHIDIVKWHYVNNPSGGFWNAVLNWDYWGIYPTYLQIEQGKLCFKISTDPEELDMPSDITRSMIRNKLHNLIMLKAKEVGFSNIRRPDRFGNGHYMTAAIVDRQNWLGNDDEIIVKENVINTLNDYLKFLMLVIK